MQSFKTQSHQRNYQGNVILPARHAKSKRHKMFGGIAVIVLAMAVIVTGGMLGVVTLHNQQLKHEVQILKTQNTTAKIGRNPNKTLPEIPISNQQQDTEPMPLINGHN